MSDVIDIGRKIIRKSTSYIPLKPYKLRNKQPVVCFTFDDCPASATTIGADLLAQYDAAGTFYICGGLTDQYEAEMLCHSKADLLRLIEGGHEVGSHLFHHKNCQNLGNSELRHEMELNDSFFDALQENRRLINFAYPFGGVTWPARRIAGKRYVTSRGIRPGINTGIADFSNLRANSVYSGKTTTSDINRIIGNTVKANAWTIFYTHDVQETPSQWGTTPALLEHAIKQAAENGCQILTMRNAIGAVGFRQ